MTRTVQLALTGREIAMLLQSIADRLASIHPEGRRDVEGAQLEQLALARLSTTARDHEGADVRAADARVQAVTGGTLFHAFRQHDLRHHQPKAGLVPTHLHTRERTV